MSKKHLLYERVSPKGSTWDAEETSIGVQFADMRKYISQIDPGAEFVEIFDEFKSGKNLNRPGVQSLLADLERKPCPWQCLVVMNVNQKGNGNVAAVNGSSVVVGQTSAVDAVETFRAGLIGAFIDSDLPPDALQVALKIIKNFSTGK